MINIVHAQRKDVNKSNVFKDVESFNDLHKSIVKTAKKLYPTNADSQNTFKGTAFEVFGEFFLKLLGNDSHIGLRNIETTSDDQYYVGTDFYALTNNGTRGQIQAKFRSDPSTQLDFTDLGGFFGRLVAEGTNVTDALIITNASHTMLRSAVTFAVNKTFQDSGHPLRVLGRQDLTILTDQYPNFWSELREALDVSCINKQRPPLDPMWDHQTLIHNKIIDILTSKTENRLQIVVPTGGGKTRNEWEAIRYILNSDNAPVVVLFAPTIELLRQHFASFNLFGDDTWSYCHVRTGKDVDRTYGEDIEDVTKFKTTDVSDIRAEIKKAKLAQKPLLIMSTYASALTVVEAVQRFQQLVPEFKINLCIADEAHRLVTEGQVRDVLDTANLPALKWLFFTATRKFGVRVGMNIEKLFGKNVHRVLAKELIEKKIIVRPRITFIHVPSILPEVKGQLNGVPKEDHEELATLVKAIEIHSGNRGGKACRVIAFNSGADKAHDFAESTTLHNILPNWYIDAVSSKLNRTKGRDRKQIFDKCQQKPKSLLLQYAIVKEGIDLPGVTGIVLLRTMNTTDTCQAIGRAVRLTNIDRENSNNLSASDPINWDKYYADVFIMLLANTNEDFKEEVRKVVNNFRTGGFDKEDVEIFVERGKNSKQTRKKELVIGLAPIPEREPVDFNSEYVSDVKDELFVEEEETDASVEIDLRVESASEEELLAIIGQ